MHVAFLTLEFPPFASGGIGTSIRNLARALVQQGHRVTVLGWGHEGSFEDQGVQVRFVGHTRLRGLGWLLHRRRIQKEIQRLVQHEHLDLVEAHDWCGPSALIPMDCPVVIRCNGSATYFGHLRHETVKQSVTFAEKTALRSANAVAAVSRYTAAVTQRLFQLSATMPVIHNGVDLQQFQTAPAAEEADTLLYFGTLARKKGVLDLGPIFSALVAQHPSARLIIAGRDAADPQTGKRSTWELLSQSFSSQAAARVTYLGPQPFDKVQEFVSRASVCLFPSYAEAFPLTWLEAMACAKTILAYRIGWAAEVIESGTDGILVDPGEPAVIAAQLRELLTNHALRRQLGTLARQKCERAFSAPIIAEQSIAWYQQVIGQTA
jgi:alpha-maltose-1-phosphate synthase